MTSIAWVVVPLLIVGIIALDYWIVKREKRNQNWIVKREKRNQKRLNDYYDSLPKVKK